MRKEEWVWCDECKDLVPRVSTHGQAVLRKDKDELLRIHVAVAAERRKVAAQRSRGAEKV